MEFYLWLVRKFCRPGGALLSIFGEGKITYAAVVSHESARLDLIWLVSSTANVNFMSSLVFCNGDFSRQCKISLSRSDL